MVCGVMAKIGHGFRNVLSILDVSPTLFFKMLLAIPPPYLQPPRKRTRMPTPILIKAQVYTPLAGYQQKRSR